MPLLLFDALRFLSAGEEPYHEEDESGDMIRRRT
jgi:hypothetical protein